MSDVPEEIRSGEWYQSKDAYDRAIRQTIGTQRYWRQKQKEQDDDEGFLASLCDDLRDNQERMQQQIDAWGGPYVGEMNLAGLRAVADALGKTPFKSIPKSVSEPARPGWSLVVEHVSYGELLHRIERAQEAAR